MEKRFGLLDALAARRAAVAERGEPGNPAAGIGPGGLIEDIIQRRLAERAAAHGATPLGAGPLGGALKAALAGEAARLVEGQPGDGHARWGNRAGIAGGRAGAGRFAGLMDGTEGPATPARFPLPEGLVVDRDVAFGDDPAQRMDVYRPSSARLAPVILYVHGGGWHRGDKAMAQMVQNKAPHFTRRGIVFVSTNYRMLPDADVLAQADDVARALAFVQKNAARWGGDPERLVLMGHSAGAHLAALMTADPAIPMDHGAQPWLATVAMDSAALDMVAIMSRRHFPFYDPVFGTDPAFWRQASPTHRLTGLLAAPTLLVASSRRGDSLPPAEDFAAKAASLGGRVEVLPVDLNHMQLNDELGLDSDYTAAVDAFLASVGVP